MQNSSSQQLASQKEIDEQLPSDCRLSKIKIEVYVSLKSIKLKEVSKFEVSATDTIKDIRTYIQKQIMKVLQNPSEDQKQIIQDSQVFIKERFIPSPLEKIGDLFSIFGYKDSGTIQVSINSYDSYG